MIIPNIWENIKCSKPPTRIQWMILSEEMLKCPTCPFLLGGLPGGNFWTLPPCHHERRTSYPMIIILGVLPKRSELVISIFPTHSAREFAYLNTRRVRRFYIPAEFAKACGADSPNPPIPNGFQWRHDGQNVTMGLFIQIWYHHSTGWFNYLSPMGGPLSYL